MLRQRLEMKSEISCGRFDFLVVGAGLYGAAVARELTDRGCKVLVCERRDHVGGNTADEVISGIRVHRYGPHIFHTNSDRVWRYVNRFAEWREFVIRPAAVYRGKKYSLPFNMKTFGQLWGVNDPEDARRIISEQAVQYGMAGRTPANLEEQAIASAGRDIYERLICGYTEKLWGLPCRELPPDVIQRIPVRFSYDDRYHEDLYQGLPEGGFTRMTERILEGIEVRTGVDFLDPQYRAGLEHAADKVIFSGPIDAYYSYRFGTLGYRSLRFETELIRAKHFQDRAVINYTDIRIPWTRITEHKFFDEPGPEGYTIITREYPEACMPGREAFYPVRDAGSMERLDKYLRIAETDEKVLFGGRLGSYRYYDMDDVIEAALDDAVTLTR